MSTPASEVKYDHFTMRFLLIIHALAIWALFYPTTLGVGLLLGGWFLTACIGITFGFHRHLTHRSFKLARPIEIFSSICGILALQGDPRIWVAHHRLHHAGSDTERDPHNARRGFWFSHTWWMCLSRPQFDSKEVIAKFSRDLEKDWFYRFFGQGWVMISMQVALGLVFLAIGGWSAVGWGIFLRLVLVYHVTWFVNSATHKFGYRRYEINDLSRNCWWVALLSFGEGWHNNHHAHQRTAAAGHRWYEIDITYYVIRGLSLLGLAWDVTPIPKNTTKGPLVASNSETMQPAQTT